MHWLYLALAILFEICGTTMLKLSQGLTKLYPTIGMMLAFIVSLSLMAMALTKIPVSVAYAIWSAAGITIISLIGFFYFQEGMNPLKITSILLIIGGIVGLHLSGAHSS